MRLFVGIELTDEARAAIAGEQELLASELGETARTLRFVRPDHLHLTLVFLGEVDEHRVASITEALADDVPMSPFSLALGGLGTFPPHGRPRIVWLGALEGADQAVALHSAVMRRLSGVGIVTEPRPFHPHLTLARVRERDRRGGAFAAKRLEFGPPSGRAPRLVARVDVRKVSLIHSRVSSAGPAYTALAETALRCP